MKDQIVSWGVSKLCGNSVSLTPKVASEIPLFYASVRFIQLRILQLFGVRSIRARGTFGFPFLCHLGDLAEFPFYHPHAHRLELSACAAWLDGIHKPVVLDVGANVGFFATQLAQMLAASRTSIYAFEPVPETFSRLVSGIRSLGLSDAIQPVCAAVSDEAGEVRLGCVRKNSLLARISDEADADAESRLLTDASAITLDDFCDRNDLSPVLIKIDVEGWEPAVMRGARSTIARLRPAILFEHNPGNRGGACEPVIPEGYEIIYVDDLLGQKSKAGTRVDSLGSVDWICNLFAIPREQQQRLDAVTSALTR